MTLRKPQYILFFGIAFFFVCDNLIFRSGLYDRVSNPEPLTSQLYNAVHYERLRLSSKKKEVLLIGNSRTHWGIWTKLLNEKYADKNIEFEQLGIAGTYEKMWFYILQAVDPKQNRYAAVVIPTVGYSVDSWHVDQENNFDNASMLAPIMKLTDWPYFLSTFSDSIVQTKALMVAVFASHNYASDIQDLLVHPSNRWFLLSRRKSAGSMWLYDWAGSEGDMSSLSFDSYGNIVSFPEQLNSFEREEVKSEFVHPTAEEAKGFTERNALYQGYWLSRIVNLYKNSSTKIIFIVIPRWSMPLPARGPLSDAPDLRNLVTKAPNVIFVDEDAFVSLEKREYFHDAIHLNNKGRKLFTEELGDKVSNILR